MAIKKYKVDTNPLKEVEPWAKQENEPAKAFSAFCQWRDYEEHEKNSEGWERLANSVGREVSTVKNWAKQWDWENRIGSYLQYKDEQRRNLQYILRQKMHDRQANIAQRMQEKILERLETFDAEELSANEMAKWLETATKIERLARGEASEVTKTEHSGKMEITARQITGQEVLSSPEASEKVCELLDMLTYEDVKLIGNGPVKPS